MSHFAEAEYDALLRECRPLPSSRRIAVEEPLEFTGGPVPYERHGLVPAARTDAEIEESWQWIKLVGGVLLGFLAFVCAAPLLGTLARGLRP